MNIIVPCFQSSFDLGILIESFSPITLLFLVLLFPHTHLFLPTHIYFYDVMFRATFFCIQYIYFKEVFKCLNLFVVFNYLLSGYSEGHNMHIVLYINSNKVRSTRIETDIFLRNEILLSSFLCFIYQHIQVFI